MKCKKVIFTGHAIRRMFERSLSVPQVRKVIAEGEVIVNYPDDKPHPSFLLLGNIENHPYHIVVAKQIVTQNCLVVIVYEPDPALWYDDFKKRR